jgi:hypothetical protein
MTDPREEVPVSSTPEANVKRLLQEIIRQIDDGRKLVTRPTWVAFTVPDPVEIRGGEISALPVRGLRVKIDLEFR